MNSKSSVTLDWAKVTGLESAMDELGRVMDGGRMHPVTLLEGLAGIGKRHLAMWMVARMLCQSPTRGIVPCGGCSRCREVLRGGHPDVMILDPEGDSIKTSDVESLQNHFNMMSPDGLRIGVIMNAERMTLEASNRALKTLEEPPEQVRIILTSSRPLLLPATIRGRCLRWSVLPPPKDHVIRWLRDRLQAAGRPPETDEHLLEWARRLRFSPGLLSKEIEDNADHLSGLHGDIRELLSAVKPQDVTRAAANVARIHKAKVPEILSAVEWELNRLNRQDLSQQAIAEHAQKNALMRVNRRRLIRDIRRQAVLGKVTLNAQLVAESIGLCGWGN